MSFTDLDANYAVTLRNGVLIAIPKPADTSNRMTLALTKQRMIDVLSGDTTSPGLDIAGDADVLQQLLSVLDAGNPAFDIVTP